VRLLFYSQFANPFILERIGMSAKTKMNKGQWLEHVARQQKSEYSRARYCREHGLNLNSFNYYRKRSIQQVSTQDTGFAKVVRELDSNSAPQAGGLRLLIGRDLCLAIDVPISPSWIAGLIHGLRGHP